MAGLSVWFLSPMSVCLAWDEVRGLSAPLLSSSWGVSFNGLNAELVRLGGSDEVLHLLSPASPCLCVPEHPGKPFFKVIGDSLLSVMLHPDLTTPCSASAAESSLMRSSVNGQTVHFRRGDRIRRPTCPVSLIWMTGWLLRLPGNLSGF